MNSDAFETETGGMETKLFTITNGSGIEATFSNYGQRLISLYVPDRKGKKEDVVLGFDSLDEYRNSKERYFGATIGRYANRIAEGRFSLEGQEYVVEKNNGENHLHGGSGGFHDVIWKGKKIGSDELVFSRTSPHMEEGYPGNLEVRVTYTLDQDNGLRIRYRATTDQKTVVNLTHHSFFNLSGAGEGDINQHILMINADEFTPVDEQLIPTGEFRGVGGTPFDFRNPKPIGKDLSAGYRQLDLAKGYDHNFILKKEPRKENGLTLAARVAEPESGRTMELYTNEPGMQFYGGNFLDGEILGKRNKIYPYRGAFCLETQHFPDSPNRSTFPAVTLGPGEIYKSDCVYKFGTAE